MWACESRLTNEARNRRNDAGRIVNLQGLDQPLKVTVPAMHLHIGKFGVVSELGVQFVQTEVALNSVKQNHGSVISYISAKKELTKSRWPRWGCKPLPGRKGCEAP